MKRTYGEVSEELSTTISEAIDKACFAELEGQPSIELREVVAIALGVVQGKYSFLCNQKGLNAIEAAHKAFLEEI